MLGKRKTRSGKQATKPGVDKPAAVVNVKNETPKPAAFSNSRLQLRSAGYRLVAILIVTLVTRWFNTGVVDKVHSQLVPWEVADLPGRGKGLLATRLIKQGERIMTEQPLFIVPKKITSDPVELINAKLDTLPLEQQYAFRNLSYADFGTDIPEEKIPLSIFQTNGISVGEAGVGIFPKTARLNHACSAGFNSVYSWRVKEQILVVHALKEIKKGEELLTTYFDTKRPRDERRNHLAAQYKFPCSCPVCSLPPTQSLASDKRLQSMSHLHTKFASWGRNEINGREAVDLVRQIWRIGEDEGYWSERGQLAADAAHVAAAHSDEHATRQWAMLAQEWYGHELGQDSDQAASMQTLIEHPRQHVAWASRDRMDVGDLSSPS